MSTRAHVIIKKEGEDPTFVYHHCDGYPSGVGHYLVEILKTMKGKWTPKTVARHIENEDSNFHIDADIHGDEDYLYVINCNVKTLACYSVSSFDFSTEPNGDEEGEWGEEIVIHGNIFQEPQDSEKEHPTEPESEEEFDPMECVDFDEYEDRYFEILCSVIKSSPPVQSSSQLVQAAKEILDQSLKILYYEEEVR